MKATLLDLGGYLQSGSDRQIQETIEPVEFGELRRTINGTLKNITDPNFRKYRVNISCSDLRLPAFDEIWKGTQLTINCVTEFTQFAKKPLYQYLAVLFTNSSTNTQQNGFKFTLPRLPVDGVVKAQSVDGRNIPILDVQGADVYTAEFSEDIYFYYRPVLNCLVENWTSNEDEAQASNSWSLSALEI